MAKSPKLWFPIVVCAALAAWFTLRVSSPETGGTGATGAFVSSSAPGAAGVPAGQVEATQGVTAVKAGSKPSGVFHDLPGEEKGEALRLVFPEPELPGIVNEAAISESLTLLAQNGSDLSRPMASRHRVLAATPEVAAQLAGWARENEFTAREPELVLGHGGVKRYAVELVRTAVPSAAAIVAEGREVFAGAGQLPGAWYQTWQGEIVR